MKEREFDKRQHSRVAICGFVIMLIEGGVRPMLVVFLPLLLDEFKCNASEFSALIAVVNASSLLSGPLSAACYQVLGARLCITVGAVLSAVGFLAASWFPSMIFVIASSLPIGIGCGIIKTAIISVQCEYFVKHRNLAMAFISIGPGVGQFLFAHVFEYANDAFSWRTSWRALAVLFLSSSLLAYTMRRNPIKSRNQRALHVFGLEVLKMPEFVSHLVAVFLAASVCIVYFIFEVPLMKERGIHRHTAASVFGSQGVASIAGRAVTTLLIHFNLLHVEILMLACYVLAQFSMVSGILCVSTVQFAAHNVLSGFGIGMYAAAVAPFLQEMTGPGRLPAAFGYTQLLNGLADFSALLAGKIVDNHGVPVIFGLAAVLALLSVAFCAITTAVMLWRRKNGPSLQDAAQTESSTSTKLLESNQLKEGTSKPTC